HTFGSRNGSEDRGARDAVGRFQSRLQSGANRAVTGELKSQLRRATVCNPAVCRDAGFRGKTAASFEATDRPLSEATGAEIDRWQGQFQGQSWGQSCSRKSRCRLYLGFLRGSATSPQTLRVRQIGTCGLHNFFRDLLRFFKPSHVSKSPENTAD